jgi:hypothetical protein
VTVKISANINSHLSPQVIENKKATAYNVRDPVPDLEQAQTFERNGNFTISCSKSQRLILHSEFVALFYRKKL